MKLKKGFESMVPRLNLPAKLIGLFLIFGLGPMGMVGWLANHQAGDALKEKVFAQLESVRQSRKFQIERFLKKCMTDVSLLSENGNVVAAFKAFHEIFYAFEQDGIKVGGAEWKVALDPQIFAWLKKVEKDYDYNDLLLIDESGNVIYTVKSASDLGKNLLNGTLKDSGLGKLFSKARRRAVMQDFEPYAPFQNKQTLFFGAPIKENDQTIGVLALQMTSKPIDEIMKERSGMGQTGEAFLVGRLDGATAYRSNRIIQAGKMGEKQSSDPIESALSGKAGTDIITGHAGKQELISYNKLDVPGLNWAVICTIRVEEAFAALYTLNQNILMFSLLCMVAVVVVGWLLARSINNPLKKIILTLSILSERLTHSLAQQERVSTQQAALVNETNTTMEELSASARQSAEQAENSANSAQSVLQLTKEGMSRMKELRASMIRSKEKVASIAKQILTLSEQTKQIRSITAMVSDFANETKMLAMNSAVEAVRAGEHGKGFSVLAVETRNLADESKKSAKRIYGLVGIILKSTDTTVLVTEEGSQTAEQGMILTENTMQTFEEVSTSIRNTSENAQQISLNIQQQSIAIKQVVGGINMIHQGAKETSSSISQIREGIQTLNKTSQQLKGMV